MNRLINAVMFLVMVLSVTAYGADIDFTKTGSITVTLEASTGEKPKDGTLTLYHAADLSSDGYTYTTAFKDCTEDLTENLNQSKANALAAYVSANGITGQSQNIGSDGTAVFDNLDLGLYLVVQTADSTGFYTANSFLVSVPLEENSAWVYDVDASPKAAISVETDSGDTPTTPDDTDDPDDTDEPSEKTPSGGGGGGGSHILNPPDESEKTSDRKPNTSTPHTSTLPADPDEPPAETEDEDIDEPHEVEVTPEEPIIIEEKEEETLPQTGQLNWPVPILAISGLLIFSLGWKLFFSEKGDVNAA